MKPPITILITALLLLSVTPAFSGGGQAGFETQGKPLLSQSPALLEMITSKFSVEDRGVMGPSDAPFKGRRLYTCMDFRGHSLSSPKQVFTIRIYFKSMKDQKFERIEIIPGKNYPESRE